jgi:hypothetical protein
MKTTSPEHLSSYRQQCYEKIQYEIMKVSSIHFPFAGNAKSLVVFVGGIRMTPLSSHLRLEVLQKSMEDLTSACNIYNSLPVNP